MEWVALVFSGFVATILAIAFFWIARAFHLTSFSPTILLGCLLIPDPRRPVTETAGFVILLLTGSTLGAVLFRTIVDTIGLPDWAGGVVAGGVMGILASLVIPVIGMNTAYVRAGSIPPPGRFGTGWGRATPVVILVGSVVYGAVFAAIHAGF